MKNTKKKSPHIGMILEQREWCYHNELGKWLQDHPKATPPEIDEAHRRLAEKWKI